MTTKLNMPVVDSVAEARRLRGQLPGRIALVPTMGALHEGHLGLIKKARALADHVLVSIFVNPTQFGPSEDFGHYPRSLDSDLAYCQQAGVSGVFTPTVDEIYPPDQPGVQLDVPALADDLEGMARPGHFAGVCRVVAKLLNIIQPHDAIFGQKDYQQLLVIKAMVGDLAMPINIISAPTVREADGLALSSRNSHLSQAHRKRALGLYKALCQAKLMIQQAGETDPQVVEQAMSTTMKSHGLVTDYAAVRYRHNLGKLDNIDPQLSDGVVALVAARIDQVRLIDNMILARPDK